MPSSTSDVTLNSFCLFPGKAGSNLREYLRKRLEERKQRQRNKSGPSVGKYIMKMKGPSNQRSGEFL